MEGDMARTALSIAGLLVSAFLAQPGQAAPDCKAAPGAPGCQSPKAAKAIVPPKPDMALKSAAEPRPRPEPSAVSTKTAASKAAPTRPNPAKQADNKAQPHKQVPHKHAPRRTARASVYRYENQPALQNQHARPRAEDARPPRGQVYEADRGPTPLPGYGCDDACRYREWLQRYSAWYEAYGRSYAARTPAPRNGSDRSDAGSQNRPRYSYSLGQSERDRLDPWHGYDPHDGPQNGY
jgi:hypothetical protein